MHQRAGYQAALAFAVLIGISAAAAPQESVLYRFKGGQDGAAPRAGLVMDLHGALYGTTASGGAACLGESSGCGTILKLVPPAAGKTADPKRSANGELEKPSAFKII
jgi:hypothetical protein